MGVLYGTNASHESHDRDYDPKGLGAISPLRRPAVVTSGGSIGVQGTGGGGGAGAGETPVQGSRARSFSINPADRSTLIRSFAAQPTPKARQAFAKSGRGSKESPMSPGSWATPAGLSGLDGLDGVFGWIKQRATPGRQVKKIVRYTGAAVVAPFVSAGTTRKVFGLSPKESSQFETGAKVTRAIAITAATLGAAKYAYGLKAASAVPTSAIGGYAPAGAGAYGSTAGTVPFATVGGSGGAGFSAASWAPAALPSTAAAQSIGTVVGTGVSSPLGFSTVGAPLPATAQAGLGTQLLQGTGTVLKTVGINVGSQALLASLSKPRAEAAQDYYTGEFGAAATPLPEFSLPTGGYYGSGGGSSGETASEGNAVAQAAPWVGVSLAAIGVYLLMSRRKA